MTRIGTFEFTAPLVVHPGGSWHFATVPPDVSEDITDISTGIRRGFGSVRVAVVVGGTSWRTSVFPDRGAGTYLLPVKKAVRVAEHLHAGDDVEVRFDLVDL
ncbi:MAG: hypothetical protein QG622_786 [Actinomycetota bacterium]|nr:hypothetical protein [Actinomycetota bacterium]